MRQGIVDSGDYRAVFFTAGSDLDGDRVRDCVKQRWKVIGHESQRECELRSLVGFKEVQREVGLTLMMRLMVADDVQGG